MKSAMSRLGFIITLVMMIACLSCSGASNKLVIGKWVNANSISKFKSIEFSEDERLVIELGELVIHGSFDVISKYRVLVTLEAIPGVFDRMETLLSIEEEKIMWILPDNVGTEEFVRGK
jgi:hypothetical protein